MESPQEFHPDLTAERLVAVGSLVANAHDSAIADEDTDKGDGNWSTGCRAYQRVRVQLEQLQKVEPWLDFRSEGALAFFILVGQCPMRIRKEAQQRRASESELQAATQVDMFGIQVEAVLRVEKLVAEDRLCSIVCLAAVSPDDMVTYHRWTIFEREEGEVIDAPPEPPYDPSDPTLSPKGAPGSTHVTATS